MSQLARNLPWQQASTQWPSTLNPVIANPLLRGQQVDGIIMLSGVQNSINHSLGQVPQGYIVVSQSAAGSIYKPISATTTTLTLEASANMKISVWIF